MPGSYTADEQAAAVLVGGIADGPTKIKAGSTTSAAGATTTVAVTHGLGNTPDFCLAQADKALTSSIAWAADATTLTFTIISATAITITYITGYTA